MRALIVKVLRKIHDMFELFAYEMFEIDRILALDNCLFFGFCGDIGAGQRAFLAIFVKKTEYLAKLLVRFRIAEAAERIAVPENAVIICRYDKGDRDFGIILEKLFVFTFIIKFIALMLTESIDAFFLVKRFEYLTDSVTFGAFDFDGRELAATVGFSHDQASVLVVEADIACRERNGGRQLRCSYRDC